MNPFKLGIATGNLFCNRVAEIALLQQNMLNGTHTVVYAPRRFGKSSLARVVMERLEDKMVCIYVDIFSVTSSEDVAETIYRCIVNALGRKAVDKSSVAGGISSFFKRLRLSIEYNPVTSLPEFNVSLGDVSAEVHLETIISALDEYCKDSEIKVCLVLDEFQEICELKDSKKVEALLRGGMQVAQNVSFMMMGSRRTILRDMFEERKRPFYKSAYVLQLPQMPEGEFIAYLIRQFAKGGVGLEHDEARQIVEFSGAYPYYTQKLAMLYFDLKAEGISLEEAKQMLISMETPGYENIYVNLTNHQKRLLRSVAKAKPVNIYGGSFLMENRLGSQGGVQNSLLKLRKLDLVEQRKEGWRVVDPIFEKWLTA